MRLITRPGWVSCSSSRCTDIGYGSSRLTLPLRCRPAWGQAVVRHAVGLSAGRKLQYFQYTSHAAGRGAAVSFPVLRQPQRIPLKAVQARGRIRKNPGSASPHRREGPILLTRQLYWRRPTFASIPTQELGALAPNLVPACGVLADSGRRRSVGEQCSNG